MDKGIEGLLPRLRRSDRSEARFAWFPLVDEADQDSPGKVWRMPSSRFDHIPTILSVVKQLDPDSILDIGVGFGKWGHLFREYTDIVASEADPDRYHREHWRVRIDGIEGYAPYITPAHRYLYDDIYLGNVVEMIDRVGSYDVLFLGDIIEHLDKATGADVLRRCLLHARKAVIVSTPAKFKEQGAACGNDLEVHRSFWTASDFSQIGRAVTRVVDNDKLLAVLVPEGAHPPVLRARLPDSGGRAIRRWLRSARRKLRPLRPLYVRIRASLSPR